MVVICLCYFRNISIKPISWQICYLGRALFVRIGMWHLL